MVVVVEVVVVVLRGARAHEEGEHEGEEENADGGGTRGTSGKHGVCECVRAQDGCVCRFSRKRCRRPAAGPIRNALKSAPPKTRRRRFVRFVEGLMTQELSRSSAADIFATLRFWGVPFNKRVLAEEEQTVATLLEKSANLEEPEQREVDFSLS
jgi:hypothetical protein